MHKFRIFVVNLFKFHFGVVHKWGLTKGQGPWICDALRYSYVMKVKYMTRT